MGIVAVRLASAAGPVLDLPIVPYLSPGATELWIEYDYFSPKMDLFGFNESASTSSRLDESGWFRVGFNYRATERLDVRFGFRYQSGRVTRKREPKQLRDEAYGFRIGGDWRLWENKWSRLAVFFAWEQNRAKDIRVSKYEHRGVVFGEDVELLDPDTLEPLPVVVLSAKDRGMTVGILGSERLARRMFLHGAVSYRWSRVEAPPRSRFFEVRDKDFLSVEFEGVRLEDLIHSFQEELPQKGPWYENAMVLDVGLDARPWRRLSLIFSIKQHLIWRAGYKENPKKEDYQSNTIGKAYLFVYPNDTLALFAYGMVSSNYVLGEYPYVYNRRVNHIFANPYGMIGLGVVVGF